MADANQPTETTPILNPLASEQGQTLETNAAPVMEGIAQETWLTLTATLSYSYSNLLLFCVPLGIAAAELGWSPVVVFTLNFLAMFPLASILTFSTEQLAAEVGSVLGGLINATFGNAVEMIVGISALREGEIAIVQSSMIGSILSSILLILGSCFFVTGLGKETVRINGDVTGILSSLMIISSASLIIPSALQIFNSPSESSGPSDYILSVSHVTSIILLIFYLLYLCFQTWTHSHLFEDEGGQAKLQPLSSSTVLILATLGVAKCSDYLVDSIDGFVDTLGVSRGFVGLIIVPIVGNGSCFVATIQWARTNKIDLTVSVLVGSILQISLFVTPVLVLVGWVIGKPMSLQFDMFQTIVLALSVLVANCLLRNGQTNYFEGLLLNGTYLVIAIAFFVHPDRVDTGGLI